VNTDFGVVSDLEKALVPVSSAAVRTVEQTQVNEISVEAF